MKFTRTAGACLAGLTLAAGPVSAGPALAASSSTPLDTNPARCAAYTATRDGSVRSCAVVTGSPTIVAYGAEDSPQVAASPTSVTYYHSHFAITATPVSVTTTTAGSKPKTTVVASSTYAATRLDCSSVTEYSTGGSSYTVDPSECTSRGLYSLAPYLPQLTA